MAALGRVLQLLLLGLAARLVSPYPNRVSPRTSGGLTRTSLAHTVPDNRHDFQLHEATHTRAVLADPADGPSGPDGGEEDDAGKDKKIRAHGILMAIGWALLLPLGALMPAHRWVYGHKMAFGAHIWFWLHVSFQVVGFLIVTAGILIAWVSLDAGPQYGDVGVAHQTLGIFAYGLAVVQVVSGVFRPSLVHRARPIFTHGHRWIGRLAIVCAWITIYLGISMYHSQYEASYRNWITPVAVVMGILLLLDVFLTIWGLIFIDKRDRHINKANQDSQAGHHWQGTPLTPVTDLTPAAPV